MATKTTKKAKVETEETDEETAAETEAEVEEYQPAPDQPGIVITGTENFGGKQGFIPAADAEKAGITVTGKGAAVAEPEAGKGDAKKGK